MATGIPGNHNFVEIIRSIVASYVALVARRSANESTLNFMLELVN